MLPGVAYTPLRHAHVGESDIHRDQLLPVEWVMLSRWDHDSGATEYCVEYLDRQTQIAAEDDSFDTLAEAERHAVKQFNLPADDWHDGVPPAPA